MSYSVTIIGINPDWKEEVARQKLAALFKTSESTVDKILQSGGYVVKNGISKEMSQKYSVAIEAAGGMCLVVEENPKPDENIANPNATTFQNGSRNQNESIFSSSSDEFSSDSEKSKEWRKASPLTLCNACGKQISIHSDKCPSCGAPNNWKHPEIIRFEAATSNDIPITMPFDYKCLGTQISGQTKTKLAWYFWVIIVCCAFPGLFIGIVPGLIIAPIMIWFFTAVYGKKETFVADVQEGTWTSSNEDFWKPVRLFLKMGSIEVNGMTSSVTHNNDQATSAPFDDVVRGSHFKKFAGHLSEGVSVGGSLHVTSSELVFVSNILNINNRYRLTMPFREIVSIKKNNAWFGLSRQLVVELKDNSQVTFVVWGRDKILNAVGK